MKRKAAAQARLVCGLELGGGKSARTAFVKLLWYPEKKRIFLESVEKQIGGDRKLTGDERLLSLLGAQAIDMLAVNAPLSLPPCTTCELPLCPGFRACKVDAVTWMREQTQTNSRHDRLPANKWPTPYTQRPADVALRSMLPADLPLDMSVEETLGAGLAPLAARMQFLARHISAKKFCEVHARVALVRLATHLPITVRNLRRYRALEDGREQRRMILEALNKFTEDVPKIFLYTEDEQALVGDVTVFDAFICAFVGVLALHGQVEKRPHNFSWAWPTIPTLGPRKLVVTPQDLPEVGKEKR